MHTRLRVLAEPPPLQRTSAFVAVRFTRRGRHLARRMMIPMHDPHVYYWFTHHKGTTTHHFDTSAGIISVAGDTIPDFEPSNDHLDV